jgi:hypothetical protein
MHDPIARAVIAAIALAGTAALISAASMRPASTSCPPDNGRTVCTSIQARSN